MAERTLLRPFLAADLVAIVSDYARELKGNMTQHFNRSFDLMVAKDDCIFGVKLRQLSVQRGAEERIANTEPGVRALVVMRNGKAAVATALNIVQLFDGSTLAAEKQLVLPCGTATTMIELSDGTLAIGMEEGTVAILDIVTNVCNLKKTILAIGVTALLALPGAHFISGHSNGRLMDGSRHTSRQFASSHFLTVTALAAFGNKYASSSLDGTVRIWDSHLALLQTVGFKYALIALCALHDGRLVVGGENQKVTVHDPTDYTCVLTLEQTNFPQWTPRPKWNFAVLQHNQLVVYDGEETCIFE